MTDQDRAVLIPHGELDIATVGLLEAEIEQLRTLGVPAIVLDLRRLAFMDSSGLRLLVRLDTAAVDHGFSFSIVDGEGPVRRLLVLTQLRDRFQHAEL